MGDGDGEGGAGGDAGLGADVCEDAHAAQARARRFHLSLRVVTLLLSVIIALVLSAIIATHRPFCDCIARCCACMCFTCDSTYCPSRFSSAALEMGICLSFHCALSFSTMELASFATSLS